MSSDTDFIVNYDDFCNYIKTLDNINDFKSNPSFTYMLEHVSFEQGQAYLSYILSKTPYSEFDIKMFCKKNDQYGSGLKYNYGFVTTSPSNLRYILHSYLILSHILHTKQNNCKIVEIGGGYGGLCLAIDHFSKKMNVVIQEYHLIDLPDVVRLQRMYLEKHKLHYTTHFHHAYEYGKDISDSNVFLVSNYCFSEILREHQNKYIQYLFPKVIHGFITWNHIPLYDFGFPYDTEDEYPLTGNLHGNSNKYVFF